MGGRNEAAANLAAEQIQLSNQMFGLSHQALTGGTDYLTKEYGLGGYDQSAKFGAMTSQAIDASGLGHGFFLNPQSMAGAAGGRAEAISQVGTQKVLSGMDEMNKIRSQLAGQGLATTNFAQQAGGLSTMALGGMAENPTMSTVNAALGLGSALYKGGAQAGWWGGAGQTGTPSGFGLGVSPTSMAPFGMTPQTSFFSPVTSLVSPGQFRMFSGPGGRG